MSNKSMLNILACGLVLFSPLSAAAAADKSKADNSKEQSWKTFTSTGGQFTVDFPTEPQAIEQKIDIPKTDLSIEYQTYLSEPHDNVVYVVSVWTYPPEIDMSKPEVNLQDGFGGMLSALPGAEVLSMQMVEFEGVDGLSFLVKSEDIYFQGMLVLSANTLYQIFAVYKEDMKEDVNYDHFIESFHLLQQTDKQAENSVKVKKARKLKI